MKEKNIRKLTIAGVLVAVAVVGSLFSIPVFGAKCSPVQHMVNVLGAVLLGPGYAVGMAFAAALIRNLLGLGSLLAFPGSMIGALLCGVAYRLCPKLPAAYAGEVFGTGILSAIAVYPLMRLFYGLPPHSPFYYIPFYVPSAAVGGGMGCAVLLLLRHSGALNRMLNQLNR